MSYDYKKEYQKWLRWKEDEEKLMRYLQVNEEIIKELRSYDKSLFNAERKFKRRQNVTNEKFFIAIPTYDRKEIISLEDILDDIENEALYQILLNCDQVTLDIITLKVLGYSINEISMIKGIKVKTIYYKIRKLKKKIENILEK